VTKHESRLFPTIAVLIVLGLIVALPERYRLGPPWLPGALGIVILAVTAAPLGRFGAVRAMVFGLIAMLTAVNIYFLGSLITRIADPKIEVDGPKLLSSAIAIWLTNVLVFALWYWHVDRGGPGRRSAGCQSPIDFQFPTPESTDWIPTFPDYAFVALNTATAFSPTDTMPLSHRAKLLMGTESLISLVTIVVVAARAVGL
jgi:hypothetical protein